MQMQIIKPGTRINFVGAMNKAVAISFAVILASVALWFVKGPKLGIDFIGGTEIEISFTKPVQISEVRSTVDSMQLGSVEVKQIGDKNAAGASYMIRVEKKITQGEGENNDIGQLIVKTLTDKVGSVDQGKLRVSLVGPRAGADLRRKAFIAVIISLALMLIYIGIRFELVFSVGAVIALFHDVIITMGFLVLTGREYNLTAIAALLTIVGFSVNDTIVIFDRIREDVKKYKNLTFDEIVNQSVNETLSRTFLTSGTVFLSVIAMAIATRGTIQDFALAMTCGVIVGTYSSVFMASWFVLLWKNTIAPKLKLDQPKKV